jgi:hypothetical protein
MRQKVSLIILTLGIVGVLFMPGILLLSESNTNLNSLTEYKDEITDIGLTNIRMKKGGLKEIFYFKLQGLNQTLGINNLLPEDHTYLLETIKQGDIVKVFFNASGKQVEEGVNLHVYQLEYRDKVLLDINDVNESDKTLGQFFLWTGVVFMFAPILLFRRILKNNKKVIAEQSQNYSQQQLP